MNEKIACLPIVKQTRQGKVRDLYDLGDKLLIVTSDRISAFDVVFPTEIPDKGKILTAISKYFFENTMHIIDNHLITTEIDEFPPELHPFRNELEGRSMLVRKTRVIPFECIVRGYLTGSAWNEYKQTGTISNMLMPEELQESQKFQHPLFTPSTKSESGHDENISYRDLLDRMDLKLAAFLKDKSIELYNYAHDLLIKKNIIVADTKFEFGAIGSQVLLIDEVLTPDSSRFWDMESYSIGKTPLSYDKQFIRDYVSSLGWDKNPPAPSLPPEIVKQTREKYITIYKLITGDTEKQW
ncbi:MAG TPA: phosphoribosylaminoimidazolesuccinocarboxamide synthase [Candidatus Cloacimonadota bacterium]|nr:phosphoribosylaminoimidazolesuccinocarboxamide synthase [Candidatus Cloacimonadota bacterium]